MADSNNEFAAEAPTVLPGRVLAVDFGLRRVGLAISDPMQIIARGCETVHYTSQKKLVGHLAGIVQENQVVKMVIGLPRQMDGREGEMALTVRRFIRELEKTLPIPVVAWDERLSTVQAQRALREMGTSYSRKPGEVDRLAAVFILQSYLDSLSRAK